MKRRIFIIDEFVLMATVGQKYYQAYYDSKPVCAFTREFILNARPSDLKAIMNNFKPR